MLPISYSQFTDISCSITLIVKKNFFFCLDKNIFRLPLKSTKNPKEREKRQISNDLKKNVIWGFPDMILQDL